MQSVIQLCFKTGGNIHGASRNVNTFVRCCVLNWFDIQRLSCFIYSLQDYFDYFADTGAIVLD